MIGGPIIVRGHNQVSAGPKGPCHFADSFVQGMQPLGDANFQNQVEGVVRKFQVVDVAYTGNHAAADSGILCMLARKFDHRVSGIDGLHSVAGLSQRDTG